MKSRVDEFLARRAAGDHSGSLAEVARQLERELEEANKRTTSLSSIEHTNAAPQVPVSASAGVNVNIVEPIHRPNTFSSTPADAAPDQFIKIDDGHSTHARTAAEWIELARRDLAARASVGATQTALPTPYLPLPWHYENSSEDGSGGRFGNIVSENGKHVADAVYEKDALLILAALSATAAINPAYPSFKAMERDANDAEEYRNVARPALEHILWIKDCGIDSSQGNHPDAERDAMYEIAKKALVRSVDRGTAK